MNPAESLQIWEQIDRDENAADAAPAAAGGERIAFTPAQVAEVRARQDRFRVALQPKRFALR